jgi:uncharacterized protein
VTLLQPQIMNNELTLTALNVYPIKSFAGIALNEGTVEGRGLKYDRRWMLIDANNRFISQREQPRLATISIEVLSDGLQLSVAGRDPLLVPFDYQRDQSESVQIWNDVCEANIVSNEINNWFSDLLQSECRLVYMPDNSKRSVEKDYAINGDIVSFADAYPFLLLTEGSLADLNERLVDKVPMNRFRPNLVVGGAAAFAEDGWKQISIGDNVFHVVKPCARCVITTIDQERGVRTGEEPLSTLSSFRRNENKVLFGQNLIAAAPGGVVRVGDRVRVL